MRTNLRDRGLVALQAACLAGVVVPFGRGYAIHWPGAIPFVAGLLLAVATLASNRPGNFSVLPAIKRGSRLIRSGPYRFIRHPMYLCVLLMAAGIGLWQIGDWTLKVPLWVLLAIVLAVKARIEEHNLADHHPDYRQYQQQTGAFLPRFHRRPGGK